MPENPEYYGMGAIAAALITAWTRMRPAMKKLQGEENTSLRTDLFTRIRELEKQLNEQDTKHDETVKAIRSEYEGIIERMQTRHDAELAKYQEKINMLIEAVTRGTTPPYTKE